MMSGNIALTTGPRHRNVITRHSNTITKSHFLPGLLVGKEQPGVTVLKLKMSLASLTLGNPNFLVGLRFGNATKLVHFEKQNVFL